MSNNLTSRQAQMVERKSKRVAGRMQMGLQGRYQNEECRASSWQNIESKAQMGLEGRQQSLERTSKK